MPRMGMSDESGRACRLTLAFGAGCVGLVAIAVMVVLVGESRQTHRWSPASLTQAPVVYGVVFAPSAVVLVCVLAAVVRPWACPVGTVAPRSSTVAVIRHRRQILLARMGGRLGP